MSALEFREIETKDPPYLSKSAIIYSSEYQQTLLSAIQSKMPKAPAHSAPNTSSNTRTTRYICYLLHLRRPVRPRKNEYRSSVSKPEQIEPLWRNSPKENTFDGTRHPVYGGTLDAKRSWRGSTNGKGDRGGMMRGD